MEKLRRNAEQILVYNNFMKRIVLEQLTVKAFANTEAGKSNTINIYIDMYKMLMDLYEPGLEVQHMNIITSTVINLCAHIRSYYLERKGVYSKIFLVYSDISAAYYKTFCPHYNISNENKIASNQRMTDVINHNLDLLGILCPYLPDIYFIKGIYEPSVIILDLIYKEELDGNMSPNLVFTRDDTAMQLPACHPNTTIFLDSKRTGISYISNTPLAISAYLYKTGRKKLLTSQAVINRIQTISPCLLSLIISLSNLPSRNIISIYDINKAINIVGSAVARGSILNGYSASPDLLYDGLFVGSECKVTKDTFSFRFKAIDLLSAHAEYMFTPFAKDTSYKIDLDDGDGVRAINNEYFRENPIDLNRL